MAQPQPSQQQTHQLPSTSDYWVGPMIGEGSFAQVLYGTHKSTKKEVAIKVMDRHTCQKHPHIAQGLFTERNMLYELRSCPEVVHLWASFVDSECIYMVLELAAGGDLQDLIQRGLSASSSKSWRTTSIPYYVRQLIGLLQFLQSKRIVHADLKPQNILCHSDGRLCLADFASAIKLKDDENDDIKKTNTTTKSAVHVPRGTSQYACPELIKSSSPSSSSPENNNDDDNSFNNNSFNNNHQLTFAVDLWSFGCILYCMLVGKSPFETESESLTVQAIMEYYYTHEKNQRKQQSAKSTAVVSLLEKDESSSSLCGEWQPFITELLNIDPKQRQRAFDNRLKLMTMDQSTSTTTPTFSPKKEDDEESLLLLLLPKAPWEKMVSEATLRDGSLGWGVFML